MTKWKLSCLGAVSALVLLSGPASAGLVYDDSADFYLNGGFPDEHEAKVYLDATGNKVETTTATGNINSQNGTPEAQLVANENIDAANGFANIKGDSGNYGSLEFSLLGGYTFTDLLFDVQLATTKVGNAVTNVADQLVVTANLSGGGSVTYSQWLTDAEWKNGNKADNSLMVVADAGLSITSVVIQTLFGGQLVDGLFETKHFQVSGCTLNGGENECDGGGGGGQTPVPVPGALPLMLSGIAGLGYLARSRRKRIKVA